MCFAVKYKGPGSTEMQVYVGKAAQLPVLFKGGEFRLVKWGKAESESGRGFNTYWAKLESIEAQKWSRLKPKAVDIPVFEFAEYGTDSQAHWHPVPEGQVLRGAFVVDEGIERVYVVTVPAWPEVAHLTKKGRWPRIYQSSTVAV